MTTSRLADILVEDDDGDIIYIRVATMSSRGASIDTRTRTINIEPHISLRGRYDRMYGTAAPAAAVRSSSSMPSMPDESCPNHGC